MGVSGDDEKVKPGGPYSAACPRMCPTWAELVRGGGVAVQDGRGGIPAWRMGRERGPVKGRLGIIVVRACETYSAFEAKGVTRQVC